MRRHDWSEKFMDELGIPRQLFPEEINLAKDVVGEVTTEASEATGLAPHIPVSAGGIDAAVSALSATAINDGDLTSMIGTSMCNGFIQDRPRLSKRLVNFSRSLRYGETLLIRRHSHSWGSCEMV